MAEEKNTYFKTAEEKHKETVKLRCKICGQKMIGKTTLSRHISHAHNNIEPVKREKIVIDTYFGEDKVNRILRKYKNGEYKNKAVPIDIGRYIRLAGIKAEEEEEEVKNNIEVKPNKHKNKEQIKTDKLFVRLLDYGLPKEERRELVYVGDLKLDKDNKKIFIVKASGRNTALDYDSVLKFIEENNANDGILYVSNSTDGVYPVESVEVISADEVTGSQIKCIVAYDSTKS